MVRKVLQACLWGPLRLVATFDMRRWDETPQKTHHGVSTMLQMQLGFGVLLCREDVGSTVGGTVGGSTVGGSWVEEDCAAPLEAAPLAAAADSAAPLEEGRQQAALEEKQRRYVYIRSEIPTLLLPMQGKSAAVMWLSGACMRVCVYSLK